MPSFLLSSDQGELMKVSRFVVVFDGTYPGKFQQDTIFNVIKHELLERSVLKVKEKIYFPMEEYPYVVPYYFRRKGDNLKKYVLNELNSGFNKNNLIVFYNSYGADKKSDLVNEIKLHINDYGCHLLNMTWNYIPLEEKPFKVHMGLVLPYKE